MSLRKSPIALTQRDTEILGMLSLRVRLASVTQISRTWWGRGTDSAQTCCRRLRRLEKAGLLTRRHATVLAMPELEAPLACWRPGSPLPDLGAIAWSLRRRWRGEPVATTIFLVTQSCANYFGGRRRGRISRAFQVAHDLGVAEMFMAIRRSDAEAAALWIDEDRLAPARRRQKLPDAVISHALDSLPELVLEFGGNYSKSRLQAFHDDSESRGLPYQIW